MGRLLRRRRRFPGSEVMTGDPGITRCCMSAWLRAEEFPGPHSHRDPHTWQSKLKACIADSSSSRTLLQAAVEALGITRRLQVAACMNDEPHADGCGSSPSSGAVRIRLCHRSGAARWRGAARCFNFGRRLRCVAPREPAGKQTTSCSQRRVDTRAEPCASPRGGGGGPTARPRAYVTAHRSRHRQPQGVVRLRVALHSRVASSEATLVVAASPWS
jgi:hypothetical protein